MRKCIFRPFMFNFCKKKIFKDIFCATLYFGKINI